MTAASVTGGLCSFHLRQMAVAACRLWKKFPFAGQFFVQVAALLPQAAGRFLRFPQTFPNLWQFEHSLGIFFDSYSCALIEAWQRLGSLKISWEFAVLGKVTRNKGKFVLVVPSAQGRRADDIYLTLMTSNPKSISP
jgi:hypothetical protein